MGGEGLVVDYSIHLTFYKETPRSEQIYTAE